MHPAPLPRCIPSQGPTEIGVMRSTTSPTGPWENVIGVPLINASVGQELNTQSRDPCAFQVCNGGKGKE